MKCHTICMPYTHQYTHPHTYMQSTSFGCCFLANLYSRLHFSLSHTLIKNESKCDAKHAVAMTSPPPPTFPLPLFVSLWHFSPSIFLRFAQTTCCQLRLGPLPTSPSQTKQHLGGEAKLRPQIFEYYSRDQVHFPGKAHKFPQLWTPWYIILRCECCPRYSYANWNIEIDNCFQSLLGKKWIMPELMRIRDSIRRCILHKMSFKLVKLG